MLSSLRNLFTVPFPKAVTTAQPSSKRQAGDVFETSALNEDPKSLLINFVPPRSACRVLDTLGGRGGRGGGEDIKDTSSIRIYPFGEENEDEDEDEDEEDEEGEEEEDDYEEDDDGEWERNRKQPETKFEMIKNRVISCCSRCSRPKVEPGDATIEVSEEDGEEFWVEPPPADMRVTLKIITSENVKVRDWLTGSAPYILIKPDGDACVRRTLTTSSQWLTPNAKFEETFEFDVTNEELPIKLVIWDHLEEIQDEKAMKKVTKQYKKEQLKGDPKEAYMRFVQVPDMDDPKADPKRRRALPQFTEIPESRTPKRAWFPVRDSPLFRTGENAFSDATNAATKGRVPIAGLTIECSFLRIDPVSGELIDAIDEVVDETEVDKRALLRFLDSTSDPPKAVWNPVTNWRLPDTDCLSKWKGVKTELRPRILTHDEKTGELLEPTELHRAVSFVACNVKATGFVPQNWFEPFPLIGTALVALHTINISQNMLEGAEFPAFSELPELTALDLSENSLRGDLSLLSLPPSLKVLNLDYNHFKGPIEPKWFENLNNLTHLRLSGNRLGCELPRKCWHFLPHLEELHMAKCVLDGGCPASIADASELRVIDLSSNELDGDLPTSLIELTWLEEVSFSGCPRVNDSRGVVGDLRNKGIIVHIWGTSIPDPT
mmetsp:Transcript_14906/g.19328  ORF Transcript_14906/g.19328 Transcript_14906/m.19328 type:complete len:661 (+) Transcript_14906:1389-3371(+)